MVSKSSNITAVRRLIWPMVLYMLSVHLAAINGLYLLIVHAKWQTGVAAVCLHYFAGFGVTAGAHRLWAHRAYSARLPLRLLLIIAHTVAFQNDLIEWVMDHRTHHRWADTVADPHDSNRGLFFSHIGWLLIEKHPMVIQKQASIDLSDLYADPLLRFQRRTWPFIGILLCFCIPPYVAMMCWDETLITALCVMVFLRLAVTYHCTWSINSIAHKFGNRPYNANCAARQNILGSIVSGGEGWHNYHHTFPADYRSSELPYYPCNTTTCIIDACAYIGQVYDTKTASPAAVVRKKLHCGDKSHYK